MDKGFRGRDYECHRRPLGQVVFGGLQVVAPYHHLHVLALDHQQERVLLLLSQVFKILKPLHHGGLLCLLDSPFPVSKFRIGVPKRPYSGDCTK